MSLFEMMNFSFTWFAVAWSLVQQDYSSENFAAQFAENRDTVDDGRKSIIKSHLDGLAKQCALLNLSSAEQRFIRIRGMEARNYSRTELVSELKSLIEAVEDDIQREFFFHYRRDKAIPVAHWPGDWKETVKKFPSATNDIEEGVDCYGLEHNTASVFHMMRVAEIGMRALARERQVSFPKHPLEWADWQNILEQTEARARDTTKAMPRGPAKDAAVAFYSGAIGQLHAFKDTYRNVVMHVRRSYDELDALRAINQVRDFMNGLSAKIGEKTRRPIRRWL